MPSSLMSVEEEDNIGEGVVVVYDIGEVDGGFSAFVFGGMKGRSWVVDYIDRFVEIGDCVHPRDILFLESAYDERPGVIRTRWFELAIEEDGMRVWDRRRSDLWRRRECNEVFRILIENRVCPPLIGSSKA